MDKKQIERQIDNSPITTESRKKYADTLTRISRMIEENFQEPMAVLTAYIQHGQKIIKCTDEKVPKDSKWETRPGLTAGQAYDWIQKGGFIGIQVHDRYVLDIDNERSIEMLLEHLDEIIESGAHIDSSPRGFHIWWNNRPDGSNWKTGIKGTASVLANEIVVTPRGGNMQIIMAPTPGRNHITPIDRLWSELPVVPDHFVPIMSKTAWRKEQEKLAKIALPKSKVSENKKIGKIEYALQHTLTTILNAQPGSRNSEHNTAIYTLAGLYAGAVATGLQMDIQGALCDCIGAARENMSDDFIKAEKDARKSWADGWLKPISCDLETIGGELKKLAKLAAASTHGDLIPMPSETFTSDQCAEKAVTSLLGKFDIFAFNNLIWYSPRTHKEYNYLTPTQDPKLAARDLCWLYERYLRFYDFDALKNYNWSHKIEGPITAELFYQIPNVRYMGIPCVLDGQFIDTDTRDIRIIPYEVQSVACSQLESFQWLKREIQYDFTYKTEQDANKALSQLFTPFLRANRKENLVPMTVWTAPEMGVGKSMHAKMIGIVASDTHERHSVLINISDETEFKKAITSFLLAGAVNIIIDNVKTRLGGQVIETLTTTNNWSDRLLGGNTTISMKQNALLHVTLNAGELTEDMCRRVCIINQTKNMTITDFGNYRHTNYLSWIIENRALIRGHIINIVRHWVASGCPQDEKQKDSGYREFCKDLSGVFRHSIGVDLGQLVSTVDNLAQFASDEVEQKAMFCLYAAKKFPNNTEFSPSMVAKYLMSDQQQPAKLMSDELVGGINMDAVVEGWEECWNKERYKFLYRELGHVFKKLVGKNQRVSGYTFHVINEGRKEYGSAYSILVTESPINEITDISDFVDISDTSYYSPVLF